MEANLTSQGMASTSISETLHIFNDNLNISPPPAQGENAAFPKFSRLLPELRLYIWKLCFPPRRIISLRISQAGVPIHTPEGKAERVRGDDHEASPPPLYYTARNNLGNTVSSFPYRVHVPYFDQWSRALKHVSRESREAFLSFYRIVFPTHHANGEPESQLCVNPDTDILELQMVQLTGAAALAALLHDALANDPAGRGIMHVALGRNINDLNLLAKVTSLPTSEDISSGSERHQSRPPSLPLHPVAAGSMRKWLQTSLRTFYCVISPGMGARSMLGLFSWPSDGNKFHNNRSVPVAAQASAAQATEYSSVGLDPRPIEEVDLAHVAVGTDPRRDVHSWYRVLDNLGVDRSKSMMRIRYLLAIWPEKCNVPPVSRQGFVHFVEDEDTKFAQHMVTFKRSPWGNRIDEETWRRQQRTLNDVAGLWVFDADTFGKIPSQEESIDVSAWRPKMVKDLTTTRPELLVFHLA